MKVKATSQAKPKPVASPVDEEDLDENLRIRNRAIVRLLIETGALFVRLITG